MFSKERNAIRTLLAVFVVSLLLIGVWPTGPVAGLNNTTSDGSQESNSNEATSCGFTVFGKIMDEWNIEVPEAIIIVTDLTTGGNGTLHAFNGSYSFELANLTIQPMYGDEINIIVTNGVSASNATFIFEDGTTSKEINFVLESKEPRRPGAVPLIGNPERGWRHNFEMDRDRDLEQPPDRERPPYDGYEIPDIDEPPISGEFEDYEMEETAPFSRPHLPEPTISPATGGSTGPIILENMRNVGFYRLAFTEKDNEIEVTLKNTGTSKYIVGAVFFEETPSGETNRVGIKVFGLLRPDHSKTRTFIWEPEEVGRNFILTKYTLSNFHVEDMSMRMR